MAMAVLCLSADTKLTAVDVYDVCFSVCLLLYLLLWPAGAVQAAVWLKCSSLTQKTGGSLPDVLQRQL